MTKENLSRIIKNLRIMATLTLPSANLTSSKPLEDSRGYKEPEEEDKYEIFNKPYGRPDFAATPNDFPEFAATKEDFPKIIK